MSWLAIFGPILLAAVLGGGSAGLLGVLIIGLRLPFLAVCTAHAALAGAIFGGFVGLAPALSGFAGALLAALLLGWLLRRRDLDPNAALGTLFSLMLGLAFLGLGLAQGPKSEALGLVWGSLLFVTSAQLIAMAVVGAILLAFVIVLHKELKVLLFNRELAALFLPEATIFTTLLVLAAGVIAVNLETVGGLLLYSLVCNPAIAALKTAHRYTSALAASGVLGAVSALGGFLTAWGLDLPVGACIVLFSSLLVGWAIWWGRMTK